MNRKFASQWWNLELPPGWSADLDKDCCSFFSENGGGALQISAFRKDEELTDADLQEMIAEDIEAGAQLRTVKYGSFTGFHFHCGVDGRYWRYWILRCGETMVYVTYNCVAEEREAEDEQVEQILHTLKVIDW